MFGTITNSSRHFRNEADELRSPVHADTRRFLHIGSGNLGDFVDLVGHDPDENGIAVEVYFDDDDAGIRGIAAHGHVETDAQIGKRNDISADIDDAREKRSLAGNFCSGNWIDDLANEPDVEREHFVARPIIRTCIEAPLEAEAMFHVHSPGHHAAS